MSIRPARTTASSTLLVLILATAAGGCDAQVQTVREGLDPDSDLDSGTDTDRGTDADADTDAGTDSDTDTDTGTTWVGCDDDPCGDHGTCVPADGSCACDDGWGGPTCTVACDGPFAITDLGVLPGHARSTAADINAHGVIVGTSWDPGARPTVWRPGEPPADLDPSLVAADLRLTAINDAGRVVGWVEPSPGDMSRALYFDGVTSTELFQRAEFLQSAAYGVDEAGRAVGWDRSGSPTTDDAAMYWYAAPTDPTAAATILVLTSTGFPSAAYGVNAHGAVVGTNDGIPFHYDAQASPALAALPGVTAGSARAITDDGVIVGWGATGGGPTVALRWDTRTADPVPLGVLDVGGTSRAYDVRPDGLAVGYASTSAGTRGVVFRDDQVIALPPLPGGGATRAVAVAPTDPIRIVGQAMTAESTPRPHAVLWTECGARR